MQSINISETGGAYMIDANGITIADTTMETVEEAQNIEELSKTDSSLKALAEIHGLMRQGKSGYGSYSIGGTSKVISYSPVEGTNGWSIGVTSHLWDFIQDTVVSLVICVAAMFAGIGVAVAAASRLGTMIGNPIQECAERINLVLKGDLSSPVPEINSDDETGILASSTKGIIDGLNSIIGDIGYLLDGMAKGDFTVTSAIKDKYVGDYKKIYTAMDEIKSRLGNTLLSVKEAAEQVSTGSDQLAQSAQSLAEGSTDQAGAVQELTATIENVSSIARQSAEAAEKAYLLVDEAVVEAEGGEAAMKELTQAMNQINDTSREIQNIITTIEDIASQTNLLSLNASIEAARAGEAGRGFAVVAEQIGQLATNSAQSAVDTRNLIDRVIKEIERGDRIAVNTLAVFETVLKSIGQFSGLSHGASEASVRQADMLVEVEKGMEQISTVVQANSALSEETSATSEELSAQADTMNELIEIFRF